LAGVRGVCEGFLVTSHASIKNDFSKSIFLMSESDTFHYRAILEHKETAYHQRFIELMNHT